MKKLILVLLSVEILSHNAVVIHQDSSEDLDNTKDKKKERKKEIKFFASLSYFTLVSIESMKTTASDEDRMSLVNE